MNLPAPPVPADADVSNLDYMPLLIHKLRRSQSWVKSRQKPELGFYRLNLWMSAWLSKPAGSLEEDDEILAEAAMCTARRWPAVKAEVLSGFEKFSDGKLYHSEVVEQVKLALEKRQKWRERKAAQRTCLNQQPTGDVPRDSPWTPPGVPQMSTVTGRDGNGRDDSAAEEASNPADKIVQEFHRLRAKYWPADMPLVGSNMTLKVHAQRWVDAGVSVEFAVEHMRATMQRKVDNGETSPGCVRFCGKSLLDAHAKTRTSSASSRPATSPRRSGGINADTFAATSDALLERVLGAAQ